MISKDKTYRTRDGREVRIYATDGKYPFTVQGAVKTEHGEWEQVSWTNMGNFMLVEGCHNDLIELKPRYQRTLWMNMYLDYPDMRGHKSEAAADQAARDDRIACIKIDLDFEEGEGL